MDVTKPARPGLDQIQDALGRCAPSLAQLEIAFLAEGWEFWAFSAGDYVLRFPKSELVDRHGKGLAQLTMDRRLLPELATVVSVAIPLVDVYCEAGPNALPFAGHRRLQGVPIMTAARPPAPSFGRDFGRFLRELHSFPVERALELGVPLSDGPTLRADRARHYEDVIRRVFPLVSCEARNRIEVVYEGYLNQPANFEFEPCLLHQDLDSNTLIDAETGALSGVIDFGDVVLSNPAIDLWLPVFGFPMLGIEDQLKECLAAVGVGEAELARMMPELAFCDFRWPLLDILHGLDIGDDSFIDGGIRALNARVPPDLRCP